MCVVCLFSFPLIAKSNLQIQQEGDQKQFVRSLESLRDLEYQTWQVVAYPYQNSEKMVILRIVGYPGSLRLDHPTALEVHSGRRDWSLNDITLSNSKLAKDTRDAAAEFELTPLLLDLTNNRPLRMFLPGVFVELPVPPYLVSEWRSLLDTKESDGDK